ncbi:MAG: DNA-protecting protein DprA [Flavobacteriaceae bacterium]|nr:DNA-protecting protein DprA [Flavobacteriaceae bacterium]
MLTTKELLYTLALQRVPNLGDTSAKKLLRVVGSAEGIFQEKKSNLLKIDGIGRLKLKELQETQLLPEAEAELHYIQENQIDYRYFLDTTYPKRLKHCGDGPILFFQRGNIDLERKKIISIVGTRKATRQGMEFCDALIKELAPLAPVIVSGFAYGIDITAQKAAIDYGLQTVGCLAHGLGRVYPRIHKKYVAKVEENGGFITEFWNSDPFERTNFLKRNRIIAGLSEATIVIESASKGGSLVTADIANSYHREVFAVPGRTTDRQSSGCNHLIKSQQAHLLDSAADLIYMLGWDLSESEHKPLQTQLFVELNKEEQLIFDYLKNKEKELLDTIALACKLPTFKVASLLLQMELKGVVKPSPGNLFQVV